MEKDFMNCAKRFWQFINKDVENANETKKVAVITRLFSLIMCVYFLIEMAIMSFSGNYQDVAAGAVFCSVYAFLFYCSNHTFNIFPLVIGRNNNKNLHFLSPFILLNFLAFRQFFAK